MCYNIQYQKMNKESVKMKNDLSFSEKYNIYNSEYNSVLVSRLPLSSRTKLVLQRNDIVCIKDLLKANGNYLLSLDSFGVNSINEVESALGSLRSDISLGRFLCLAPDAFTNESVTKIKLPPQIMVWLLENDIKSINDLLCASVQKLASFPEYNPSYLNKICDGIDLYISGQSSETNPRSNNEPSVYNQFIKDIPFSNRTKNRLLENDINTVDKLIKTPIKSLCEIRGFGASCVKEVEEYLHGLNISDTDQDIFSFESSGIEQETRKAPIPHTVSVHKEQILNGDFSFIDINDDNSTRTALSQYKEAYETLGKSLVNSCVHNTKEIREIILTLNHFRNSFAKSNKLSQLMNSVPMQRRNCKINGFINTFAQTDQERETLHRVVNNENCELNDILNFEASTAPHNYDLVQRFVSWCAYDLKSEIRSVMSVSLKNERAREVVLARAQGVTLQGVGETFNITRERVRQIEMKARRLFARGQAKARIISKISADNNGITVITPEMVMEYAPEYGDELVYLLKTLKSNYYTYDKEHDVFIYGDSTLSDRVQDYVDSMPDTFRADQLETYLSIAVEEEDFPKDLVEKTISTSYKITGEVYHKSQLSKTSMYESILEKYFPDGLKACDPNQMDRFKELIAQEYGAEIKLPDNNHAIAARLQDIATICDRGTYIARSNQAHMPDQLARDIHDYIKTNESKVFLTNTLFAVFEDKLLKVGINNKYYLQSILREKYEDEFIFRRDYISRDASFTSIHTEIVNYIKESNYPVSKQQIFDRFPGLTEVVLSFATGDNNIINLFGQYFHASKLKISFEEKERFRAIIADLVSDGKPHHSEELFIRTNTEIPGMLSRNFALYPFSAFSIAENLFRNEFQFSRPLFAQDGVEDIGYATDRMKDYIYKHEQISFEEMSKYAKEIHYQIFSYLELSESLNDKFFMRSEKGLISIEQTGITEDIAKQVENIVCDSISDAVPIRELPCIYSLPPISVNWTEWLVLSTLKKWSSKLSVATSSPILRMAVPLVSPIGKMDAEKFAGLAPSKNTEFCSDSTDDISTDDLLMELIDDDSLWEDLT